MIDANPIYTLRDYSKPSHEGYKKTIELPIGKMWIVKLHNDILMFQQHQGESLSEAWTRFKDLLKKVPHYGIDLWLQVQIFYDHVNPVTRRTIDQSTGDVPSTSDRRFIELENQVQCLMEAHLALTQPTQVNKITTSCEICSGPHDTQYCMKIPNKPLFNMHPCVPIKLEASDARLSKFEADFKQQQSEMTNKIDTVLKAITDRIAGALPSDTVKNPKLSTFLIFSACSYPTEDPQCSTHIHGLTNTITIHPKQQNDSRDRMAEGEEQKREGDLEDTNTIAYIEERRDRPLLERKDITVVDNLGSNKDDKGIKWLDVEEPSDLVNTSEESVYESLIKEMPKCSLNYNVRKNGYEYRGRNFVGLGRDMRVFVGNISYVIDFTILENIESSINPSLSHVIFRRSFIEIVCLAINRKHGLMTFMDRTKEITFKTPYKDPKKSELSSEGHDLLSSRVILNEDDYDRGCRKPSDLEEGFYRDTIKLGPKYVTGMYDEGEVTMHAPSDERFDSFYHAYVNYMRVIGRKAHLLEDKQIPSVGVFDAVFLALGWLMEEIHMTLEKKQTRLRTYTKSLEDFCKQWLETASQA
ncbi:hypothetical protein Tco_1401142 [Tanacetum coccineum]